MKFKTLTKDTDLCGLWDISYKIDGIQVTIKDGKAYSKANKQFDNLNQTPFIDRLHSGTYEFFRTFWNESVSLLKNSKRSKEIKASDLYTLEPTDKRLQICQMINPTQALINNIFNSAVKKGYEGLILFNHATNTYYKKKQIHSLDVQVISVTQGSGRNKDRLGAIVTTQGNVGIGITDEQRESFFNDPTLIGSIIEVECMEFTPNGLMRHARFIRRREDKDTENLDG